MDTVSFLLLVIFIAVTLIPFIEKYRKWKRLARKIDAIGGDKSYPIVGTNWPLLRAGRKNFWREYLKRNARNRAVYRTWTGFSPVVHLTKPNHIELVLNSSENVDKGANYKFIEPWFGNGLLTSKKNKWKIHRKLLTPCFHFTILEQFSEVFSRKGQMLADHLLPFANGEYVDLFPYIAHCALDIICETAMGVKLNSMENSNSEYVEAVQGVLELIVERMFNVFHQSDFIFGLTEKGRMQKKYLKILHGFTEKVIRERQEQLAHAKDEDNEGEDNFIGVKRKETFLDTLLKINDTNKDFHLSFEDIRAEVDTFMFGGHDSSTVTICWTLFLLGNNLDIQEKVHQELDSIFGGEERPVTSQDLLQMKYLECVIKESSRIFSPVPAVTRILSTEIDIDGHKIPPGVTVVLHFFELHKSPENFPDPNKFDPDRFLPENSRNRHPFAFIPFSAGPRNCIGQKYALRSAKTLLAILLRKYRVRSQKKIHEVDCFLDIFLKPQDGMHLSLEVRK